MSGRLAAVRALKKGAKSFQRAVRAGDPGAAEVVNGRPRLGSAAAGSAELAGFTHADAQWVVARSFGLLSWPKLTAHLELVERYARSPHQQPTGGPIATPRSPGGSHEAHSQPPQPGSMVAP
jgi:hypothetical protein